jgi:hypothetical protein
VKRKTSTTPTKIYSYGCLPPIVGAELMDQQIQRAHRYRNILTEIELRRRERVQKEMLAFGDVGVLTGKVEALAAQLTDVRVAIKAKRQADRKRVEAKSESERAKALLTELRDARAELKAAKEAVRTDVRLRERLREIEDQTRAEIRAARSVCGTYWGTYLTAEAAAEASRKSMTPPRFLQYDGSGRIAVEIMHGMPVAEVFECKDTRLQIRPVPADTYQRPRKLRELASRTMISIRAGSNNDRSPKWVQLPVILHRPMPPDALIKWAWILRRRIGLHFQYQLQLVLESESFQPPEEPLGSGTVAIDLGWRTKPDESIRVGYLVDEAGHREEILVPDRMVTKPRARSRALSRRREEIPTVDRTKKPEDLQAIRDKHFETIKAELRFFLDPPLGGEHVRSLPEIPAWLEAQTRSLAQWRSPGRLVRLLHDFEKQRFEGDAKIVDQLTAWAKRDRHLLSWEAHQRARWSLHRREEYRKLAARLVRTYAVIVLEKFNLRDLTQEPAPEDGVASEGRNVRSAARLAAPGELRAAIKVAAEKYGAKIVELSAIDTTQRCHACGTCEPWDAAPTIEHKCAICGATWDQDYNACMNLLHLASPTSMPVVEGMPRGAREMQARGIIEGSFTERPVVN